MEYDRCIVLANEINRKCDLLLERMRKTIARLSDDSRESKEGAGSGQSVFDNIDEGT